jgi:hypothetical protein
MQAANRWRSYSRLAIADAQTAYADAMGRFPV